MSIDTAVPITEPSFAAQPVEVHSAAPHDVAHATLARIRSSDSAHGTLDLDTMEAIARQVAAEPSAWQPYVVHDLTERRPVRVVATEDYEVWVIGWTRGQRVELHDHGSAAGALAIAEGLLTEMILDDGKLRARDLRRGDTVPLPAGLVHEVVSPLGEPVTSVHVYSPPLTQMSFYDLGTGDSLRTDVVTPGPTSAISVYLDQVRAPLDRVLAEQLDSELARGALVVDIRPCADRDRDGVLPGAVVVERIHLEWRLDPTSPDRLEGAVAGRRVIVVCNEGYASSLAADTLRSLGVRRATDLVGGYRAWAATRTS